MMGRPSSRAQNAAASPALPPEGEEEGREGGREVQRSSCKLILQTGSLLTRGTHEARASVPDRLRVREGSISRRHDRGLSLYTAGTLHARVRGGGVPHLLRQMSEPAHFEATRVLHALHLEPHAGAALLRERVAAQQRRHHVKRMLHRFRVCLAHLASRCVGNQTCACEH